MRQWQEVDRLSLQSGRENGEIDAVQVARGELGDDPAAQGVAQQSHSLQAHRLHPVTRSLRRFSEVQKVDAGRLHTGTRIGEAHPLPTRHMARKTPEAMSKSVAKPEVLTEAAARRGRTSIARLGRDLRHVAWGSSVPSQQSDARMGARTCHLKARVGGLPVG